MRVRVCVVLTCGRWLLRSSRKKLSNWNAKTLSVGGGRLTLLKLILGSMEIYYMSLFNDPLVSLYFWSLLEVASFIKVVSVKRSYCGLVGKSLGKKRLAFSVVCF